MDNSSAKPESHYHVRSISMPSGSHPSTLRIDEELNKVRNLEAFSASSTSSLNAEVVCNGLASLVDLYNHVEDLLHLPLTQQELAHCEYEKWVDEVLDQSIRMLDMCSTIRDILLSMKEHVQDVQSTLRRRRGGDLCVEDNVGVYICFRKKVKKDVAKCLAALKRMNAKSAYSPILDQGHHLSMVIRALSEVNDVTTFIFQSILSVLSPPRSKTKHSRWSLVSKLMKKGQVACEGVHESAGEVESVDSELHELCQHISSKDLVERVQRSQRRLETLEVSIEGLETGLECLFRRLIQTRVSILNIVTL